MFGLIIGVMIGSILAMVFALLLSNFSGSKTQRNVTSVKNGRRKDWNRA